MFAAEDQRELREVEPQSSRQALDAFAEAEAVMIKALVDGEGFMVAAERACTPVRRRVCANSRRLSLAME